MLKGAKIQVIIILAIFYACSREAIQKEQMNLQVMEEAFIHPPDSVRPWVLWDWISGNVTREGITKDLESMKRVGIGGVVWREIGGLWWAPFGDANPYSKAWHDLMQWAISESGRLGIEFSASQDFGYGSGGPHITPDNSMQQLVWNDTIVDGGSMVGLKLSRPDIPKGNIGKAWLRPGEEFSRKVLDDIEQIDSYRDIAILAIPISSEGLSYEIPQLGIRTAMDRVTYFNHLKTIAPPAGTEINRDRMVDLTTLVQADGNIKWDAPAGRWKIIRMGHASNFLMTRPCPTDAIGLECNRLSKKGIDAHFDRFMKPILDQAGPRAGKTLTHLFLDSWEAGCQNWTAEMPQEFRQRRGYDITPWLPVLTGSVVENAAMSERFLWDFRQTVNDLIIDNYLHRMCDLIEPYGMKFSVEAYGNLSINTMQYAEMADYPVSEFWTMGTDEFPEIKSHKYYSTMKAMASAAHTAGIADVGAEAFTGYRGWKDHPFIFKGVGDEAFCRGVNHFYLHLSAHQAYDDMVPGLTHQKWGGHFNRFNTWWEYSKPWFDYLSRSQYLLKQGQFVADICYFFGEGAPLDVRDMALNLPAGYDYDFCSSDVLQQMEVNEGRIVLPSGMSYQYLLLPDYEYMTLSSMQKIESLIAAGANVIGQKRITGTPGLEGFPDADEQVRTIADRIWGDQKIRMAEHWEEIFKADNLSPDFLGEGLDYIHRKSGDIDIFFVSNPLPEPVEKRCTFRVEGKIPELWNPETGEIRAITEYSEREKNTSISLNFNPMQSWFVIFRNRHLAREIPKQIFSDYGTVTDISGAWMVRFDPKWGGPEKPVVFDDLADWSQNHENGIKYYSGTATYENKFTLSQEQLSASETFYVDLGKVGDLARIRVNGTECGIAWKQPYRIDISGALHAGENILEVDVVNSWVNRMIGDEQLPEDCEWIDWIRLKEWPEWFLAKENPRASGRYTFSSVKHYKKSDRLISSGLFGPVKIVVPD